MGGPRAGNTAARSLQKGPIKWPWCLSRVHPEHLLTLCSQGAPQMPTRPDAGAEGPVNFGIYMSQMLIVKNLNMQKPRKNLKTTVHILVYVLSNTDLSLSLFPRQVHR